MLMLFDAMKAGHIRTLSSHDESTREITRIEKLYDVGPVTFPAYHATDTST